MQDKFIVQRLNSTGWDWTLTGHGLYQAGECKTKRECVKIFEQIKEVMPDLEFERGVDRYLPVLPKVRPGDTVPCDGCGCDIDAKLGYQMLKNHHGAFCEPCVKVGMESVPADYPFDWHWMLGFQKYYKK